MGTRSKLISRVKEVLLDRMFSENQINKLIPKLNDNYINEPHSLAQIIDTWNIIMSSSSHDVRIVEQRLKTNVVPTVAKPPTKSKFASSYKDIDMTTILAEVEPSLLLFDPEKLVLRHNKVLDLRHSNNLGEHWMLLFNAPRGYYLQDWSDLTKKIYYIEHNLIDLIYDKKEVKEMEVHPITKSASIVEADFNHIRTRYLFALRSGYKSLSHLYSVQMASTRPVLNDIIMTDNATFLKKFSPFCSLEEYSAFSNLIKNNDYDADDAEIFEKLAELNSLNA